jgi:hypothetical protein
MDNPNPVFPSYNLYEMGGGLGADFYLWSEDTFGFYFRFNFYKPYIFNSKDDRYDEEYGLGSIGNLKRDLNKSWDFDINFGLTKKFKIKKFEIPIVWAIKFPRIVTIKYESDVIRHESILEFGFVSEAALRYNISKVFFVQIGGLVGIGIATSSILHSQNAESIAGNPYISLSASANIGIGFSIKKNKKVNP